MSAKEYLCPHCGQKMRNEVRLLLRRMSILRAWLGLDGREVRNPIVLPT
jgi:hypothetical protein